MTEEANEVSANDIILGNTKPATPKPDNNKPTIDDSGEKVPTGVHPVVQERLERERNAAFEEAIAASQSAQVQSQPQHPTSGGDYVTRNEMIKFTNELNVQLSEISRWLTIAIDDTKSLKSANMSINSTISNMQSKLSQIFRNQ